MIVAIARFPRVPAERDEDFRAWFAWSNLQLSETEGLKARRLLRSEEGAYVALVEHDSAETLAAMHATAKVAQIHERLAAVLPEGPHATRYDVVVDDAVEGSCCGGSLHGQHHEVAQPAPAHGDRAAETPADAPADAPAGCCHSA